MKGLLIKVIRSVFPRFVLLKLKYSMKFIKACSSYLYDLSIFLKHSTVVYSIDDDFDKVKIESNILLKTHSIEKGLSFLETRPGFGKQTVNSLLDLLEEYKKNHFGANDTVFLDSICTLQEYIVYQKQNNIPIDDIKSRLDSISDEIKHKADGTINIYRKDIQSRAKKDFKESILSRHSIRNFENSDVPINKIINAIKIAKHSPSSCNRQCWRVYLVKNQSRLKKALKLQTGNRGFGNLINKLLIITTDVRVYHGIHERNTGYVDGGIFISCLLQALHYEGLATCPLNWSVMPQQDKQLRDIIKIGNSEIVICFIAVGNMPEKLKVAKSQKILTDNIVKIV